MEYMTLPNSELNVSRLCMGGCPMGQYGWGKVEEAELLDAVNKAIDNGINFFDTADIYGLGKSEETLSKGLGSKINQVIIASKFGVRIENGKTFYDNSPEWIETAIFASLRRLNRDYIDLYQVHYRDVSIPIGAVIETLERLKDKGYIRYYGLSNIHQADLLEFQEHKGKFISFQDEYSLACRKNEKDLLVLSKELQMTPMTWGSLGQGILSGKYDENSVFDQNDRRSRNIYVNFHGERLKKNLSIVNVLRDIAAEHKASVSAVAIRFILDYIENSIVLVGAKSSAQILGNIEAMGWNLTKEEVNKLVDISN
ncbi:MAG: aldo/keto reductase [Bacillota bacterium]|nr:aldo/keto reductase [Bacillota bacterium]